MSIRSVSGISFVYTNHNGIAALFNNAAGSFQIQITASSTGYYYTVVGSNISSPALGVVNIDRDLSFFQVYADGVAKPNAGSLWFIEDDGYPAEWHIRTVTLDSVATPTKINMTMERVDNTMITAVFTDVSVSAYG